MDSILIRHTIDLVRYGVVRGDHCLSGIVNIGRVVVLKNVSVILTTIIPLHELLEHSLLGDELGAGVNIEKDALSALLGFYIIAWPLSAPIMKG